MKRGVRMRLSLGVSIVVWVVCCFVAVPAFALGEGRVYEMVSPVFKGGYGALLQAVAPDGERVAFSSLGVFEGVPRPEIGSTYLATREAGSGWSTTPLQPPFREASVSDFSSTFEYALMNLTIGFNEVGNPFEGEFAVHRVGAPDTAESWAAFPVIMRPAEALFEGHPSFLIGFEKSASNDLCHIVVEGGDLLPESPFAALYRIYDLARGCGGEQPSLRLIPVRNKDGVAHGEPEEINEKCGVQLGFGATSKGARLNAMSGDGSEIFFTADAGGGKECNDPQLFLRVGGERTVEVSRPVDPASPFGGCGEGGGVGEVPGEVPCPGAAMRAPAAFEGASEDGTRAFFTASHTPQQAPLVPGDTDASNDLYMASIGCPAGEPSCQAADRRVLGLVDASPSEVAGEPAEVAGVVSMAGDGSRVYFVAHGVLTSVANEEGDVALKGADNLYVYDASTNAVAFIAGLCSGPESSGSVEDVRCPSSVPGDESDALLWEGQGEAQSTQDGEYLVFSTFARLIERGTQTDANNSKDVYRYDAASGKLDRVSLGEGGYEANGNGEGAASIEPYGVVSLGAEISAERRMATRALSEDGSEVVFSSVRALSPDATNHQKDIYIWRAQPGESEGKVSLISSGSSLTNDVSPVITADGLNVFFTTSAGLVPADTESDLDVYDARVEGGFPEQPEESAQCSSDACQGALTSPAPLLVPGSAVQAPGENYPAPKPAKKVKKKAGKKIKRRKIRGRAKKAKGRGR